VNLLHTRGPKNRPVKGIFDEGWQANTHVMPQEPRELRNLYAKERPHKRHSEDSPERIMNVDKSEQGIAVPSHTLDRLDQLNQKRVTLRTQQDSRGRRRNIQIN
jgi:hypothetical protein